MIEAEAVVRVRLAQSRDGKPAAKGLSEELFNPWSFFDRPLEAAVKTRELGGLRETAHREHGHAQNFLTEDRFSDRDISLGYGMAQLMDALERGDE